MHAEAETIHKMSETLESANFTRDESDAFIQSVALAMKTFAVTPQVLDDRLEKLRRELRREWKEDLVEVNKNFTEVNNKFAEVNRKFAEVNDKFGEVNKQFGEVNKSLAEQKNTIDDLKRSLLSYLLGFALVTFASLMGMLAAILTS